jgi:hypothetical protein
VVAVVLEVGNWHALSVFAIMGIQQGKDQPFEGTLAEERMIATLSLEVLDMPPESSQVGQWGWGK